MATRIEMTERARGNLSRSGYDPDKVAEAWERGDYGTLRVYQSDVVVRPATADEAVESAESFSPAGCIPVECRGDEALQKHADGEAYVTCYVEP